MEKIAKLYWQTHKIGAVKMWIFLLVYIRAIDNRSEKEIYRIWWFGSHEKIAHEHMIFRRKIARNKLFSWLYETEMIINFPVFLLAEYSHSVQLLSVQINVAPESFHSLFICMWTMVIQRFGCSLFALSCYFSCLNSEFVSFRICCFVPVSSFGAN